MILIWYVIIICCMNKLADHQTCSQILEIPSPVDFPKENGICYSLTHCCLCHVCQRWHYDIQTWQASYIKTNNSRLRNTVLQYEQTADRNGRTIITRLRKPSFKCLGTCTAGSWIILIDINIPLFHVWWVAKFVFFSSFLDLIFYKTAIWISWQVLSTFPTSAPLVKRFAPSRKIRVFVPPSLASWTCKNYKYRCISHFACTMYLIRKPDRQSCSEKIIKLCDYNLISAVGSPTRINNFLNPAKCLRKKK